MFQPMIIALTALVFASLFLIMTLMDLRRIEDLVVDVLKMQAFTIADSILKTSRQRYDHLVSKDAHHQPLSEWHMDENAFSEQDALSRTLIEWLKSVDIQHATDGNNPEDRRASGQFSAIAMLDGTGKIVNQTGTIPSDILAHGAALSKGLLEIDVHLFNPLNSENPLQFVGIRRQGGTGAILVILDDVSLKYWNIRTAVQQAFSDRLWGKDVVYLSVEDTVGNPMAYTGNLPKGNMEECLLMASRIREPGSPATQCMKVGDVRFLELSFPFVMDDTAVGTIRVGLETQETGRLLLKHRRHAMFWAGLMMIIGFLAMWLLYRTQNRHIRRIQNMQEALHHAEKLSSLGKLGAEVAHEIRNPLNAVSMAAQRLQREFEPDTETKQVEYHHITHVIRDEVRRLNGIVEDFLSLSRTSRPDLRPQSITSLLDSILFLLQEESASKGIAFEKKWPLNDPHARMDAAKIRQAFINLIRNAMESISGTGVITLAVDSVENGMIAVSFQDTGSGIPADQERQIFDPYFTTKKNGTGLGLCIAHEIILAHGGQIRVASESGQGATFEVLLTGLG
ncbi:MAG: ATP-binding protein [Desulfatirhabdiaceae bacterium]